MGLRRTVIAVSVVCLFGEACSAPMLPVRAEALIVVDIDAPVPKLVSAFRLDLQGDDGVAYGSQQIARPDARDWPVSFSVFDPNTEHASRSVLVRLRAFPEGRISNEQVVIDRLVRVTLKHGERGSVRLVLRGTCMGTPADMANGTSCVDTEGVRVPAPQATLDPDMTIPDASVLVGTFGAPTPCAQAPRANDLMLFDGEVCVPGGVFLLGNLSDFDLVENNTIGTAERPVVVTPFRMDRWEVTVGRWKAAVRAGFVSPDLFPLVNDQPIDASDARSIRACTFSMSAPGRDLYPVNCVSFAAANAFCNFSGGALASEAQWEYAAQAAARDVETTYPWGDSDPTCDRAIFQRYDQSFLACPAKLGRGPRPENDPAGDESVQMGVASGGLSIFNLAGNVGELTSGSLRAFDHPCWSGSMLDTSCDDPTASIVARGGGWGDTAFALRGIRVAVGPSNTSSLIGLRCVRKGTP